MKKYKKIILGVLALTLAFSLTGCTKNKENNKNDNSKVEVIGSVSGENREDLVTITFDVNGGEEIAPILIKRGEEFTFPTPTREGYKFNGWSNVQGTVAFMNGWAVPEDITAFANWEELEIQDKKPISESRKVENGERTIEIVARVDVPSEVKNDPKWNPNTLINGADYGEEKLLGEKVLSYEGTIKKDNQKHQMKIYFVGYELTEYVTGIFEIEVDGNLPSRFLADALLIVDLDKDDGYTEVLAEDKWELATDYTVGRLNDTNVENIGGFGTVNGIEDLRSKNGKFFVSRIRFEEDTVIPEYFEIVNQSIEYKYTLSSNVYGKEFTVTSDTIKDLKANTDSIKVGDKIKLNAVKEDGAISEGTFYGGTIYNMQKENGDNVVVGRESVLSM